MSHTVVLDTPYFISLGAAISFYGQQYGKKAVAEVRCMIEKNEIVVGKRPVVNEGEELLLDQREGRYKIRRTVSGNK